MDLHFFKWMPRDKTAESSESPIMLVFLHGMGGTGQIWRPIGAILEDHFLCIAPDQRGHGKSRPVPSSEQNQFHASDYARDVLNLLNQLNHEHHPHQFFLIGHSMGVRTGLATAISIINSNDSLRKIFKGLISVDIGFQSKWGGGIGKPLADFIRHLPKSFNDRNVMREYLFKHCPDPAIAQYLAAVSQKIETDLGTSWVFPFDHESLVQTITQANEAPIEQWVKEICNAGIPILALRGANSKVWLKEDYEIQKEKLAHPLLTFEEWPDCGHGLPFEQRALFINKVREFCQK